MGKSTKLCSNAACGRGLLPLAAFGKSATGRDGYRGECQKCREIKKRTKSGAKLDESKARLNEWLAENPDVTDRKPCTKCNAVKPLADFHNSRNGLFGRRADCSACVCDAKRLKREADPDGERARWESWIARNPGKTAEYNARYLARKTAATFGSVSYPDLYGAYPDCYLCGEQLTGPREMDHVVPLVKGGSHGVRNLRPTHKRCNAVKTDRGLGELTGYSGSSLLGAWTATPVTCLRSKVA